MQKFNQQDVFEVACAIYRINGGKVNKDFDKTIKSSKQLLVDHFTDIAKLEVTDADCTLAEECCSQLKNRALVNQLTNRTQSDFIDSVLELAQANVISLKKFGIAVWVPQVVAGIQAEDQQKVDVGHLAYTSQYQGQLGSKLAVNFEPIRVKFVREYSCFRHLGHDGNGNLIGFLHKKELSGKITGKVKAHQSSKFISGKVTYLNYVKESK